MRIISGNFRGKKLFLSKDRNTRPLKDIVKESIFNLILHSKNININIENSFVLDLFSGTGSFGIECISRGAKKVVFFENYSEAIKILKKNLDLIQKSEHHELIEKDFFNFSSDKDFKKKFDIIFIDPPFKERRINEIINIILDGKMLINKGVIIIHRHKKDDIKITNKLKILENRTYGISKILFGN